MPPIFYNVYLLLTERNFNQCLFLCAVLTLPLLQSPRARPVASSNPYYDTLAEIDRVMKKVDEGVLLFDDIWEKVYSAEQQNQKEKYEMDLKKEIKKLQRLRDQIKTWIGSSDVKDKEPLIDARRLIETKMEQFKICEKETKTKTYSKEGLARQEKLDPAEEAKLACTTWIREYIEQLQQLVEDREVEIEQLSTGKGKKTNKHAIEESNMHVSNHKFHVSKLEGITRLVNNDRLDVEIVNSIKDDLDYYLDSYEDEDYQQAYDEDFFYETLGLEELDVVNVDTITHVEAPKKKAGTDDSVSASSKGSKKDKPSKKSALASVIPMTIGRARVSSSGKDKEKEEKAVTPSKLGRANSTSSSSTAPPSTPPAVPVTRTASVGAAPAGGASMAAILKRETEQQEKERQKVSAALAVSHVTHCVGILSQKVSDRLPPCKIVASRATSAGPSGTSSTTAAATTTTAAATAARGSGSVAATGGIATATGSSCSAGSIEASAAGGIEKTTRGSPATAKGRATAGSAASGSCRTECSEVANSTASIARRPRRFSGHSFFRSRGPVPGRF